MKEDRAQDAEIYAPDYYRTFRCIADRCSHSCCIDWEICIDAATYEKYKQLPSVAATVQTCEDGPCFALREDGRCPHLNARGLCEIILAYGEAYLSEICRNHPRFFSTVHSGRIEAGLGIVCEEACRLILEADTPFSLSRMDASGDVGSGPRETDFDPLPQRERVFRVIEDSSCGYNEKRASLMREFALPALFSADEWLTQLLALEILESEWEQDLRAMRNRLFRRAGEDPGGYGKYYERLLTYFVYRHLSTAENETDFRARLAFSMLSVEVIRSLFEENQAPSPGADTASAPALLIDFARRYSAEIEYSEENTAELIFLFESALLFDGAAPL